MMQKNAQSPPNVEPRTSNMGSNLRTTKELRASGLDVKPAGGAPALTILGTIHNGHDVPRYIKYKYEISEVRLHPEWAHALEGVQEYSHLWIIWHMGAVKEVKS